MLALWWIAVPVHLIALRLREYSDDGVDLTLIRWMLSLRPAERLEFLQERIDEIAAIRELNAGS